MDWKIIYEDLKAQNWIILLILSSISYFLLSPSQTLGTILGGFLIIANFKVFQHTIRKAFSPDGLLMSKKISIIAKYYFRLLVLGAIIFVLINEGLVDPIGLAIGLSTVVISIVFTGISMAFNTFTKEAS
ncbi:ATP synthase subunit I [Thermodesulfobacteriota bacterium]